MNKLPAEILIMIDAERRKAFRKRVEEFEEVFEFNVGWKNSVLDFENYGIHSFVLSENGDGLAFDFAFSYKYGITAYRFIMADELYGIRRGVWLERHYDLGLTLAWPY
jgi:hypothetical protein